MKIGDIVIGKILTIKKTYLIVSIFKPHKTTAILHISEISDYYLGEINKVFDADKFYEFIILDDDPSKLKVSWKKINPRFMKDCFSFEICETKSGFKNLKEFVNERINSD